MIENARNHPNITLDVEGFELHQDDIPEKLLDSIDFWNFQDVVTKLVYISWYFFWPGDICGKCICRLPN